MQDELTVRQEELSPEVNASKPSHVGDAVNDFSLPLIETPDKRDAQAYGYSFNAKKLA